MCPKHQAALHRGEIARPHCTNDYITGCTATDNELSRFDSLRREELRQSAITRKIQAMVKDTNDWTHSLVDNLDKPMYTSTKQNEDRKMDNEPKYSINTYLRVYDDLEGSYIQIGPDRDGLNNVELIYFNDMNHEEGSILMPYGQFEKFMEACEIIYASLDL
jgi:hypothetical protein